MPTCMLDLDRQLRAALPDLLGSTEDGDFVLGYAQVTRMCSGNTIKRHVDSPHFGDVIVTIGLAGSADVLLFPASSGELGGGYASRHERHKAPSVPDWLACTTIHAGEAYVLYGICRQRYAHSIVSSPTDACSPEFGPSVSRVAVTLRYQRRSYCDVQSRLLLRAQRAAAPLHIEGRSAASSTATDPSPSPPLTPAEEKARSAAVEDFAPGAIVDVLATTNPRRNPFTQPALVLGFVLRRPERGGSSSALVRRLRVQYLSDGRTVAAAPEAVLEFDDVDPETAVRSSAATVRRCYEEHPELREQGGETV